MKEIPGREEIITTLHMSWDFREIIVLPKLLFQITCL